jgi:hypothetical protein
MTMLLRGVAAVASSAYGHERHPTIQYRGTLQAPLTWSETYLACDLFDNVSETYGLCKRHAESNCRFGLSGKFHGSLATTYRS